MAKSSINNIVKPEQEQTTSAQPNALQQMAATAPAQQTSPTVQQPMQAAAMSASPIKALSPTSLTSLTAAKTAQPTALQQMSNVSQKGAAGSLGAVSNPQASSSTPTSSIGAPKVLGNVKAGVQGAQQTAPTSNLPSNSTMLGDPNNILSGTNNTALADFSKTVGGQYAGTPWSNALQESLNQYSKVWEETKLALSQQYRDNNLSAATNAAASGFSPFGAASADLSRQASTNNYRALNDATINYGTGLSNIMGQYGQNAFNAQAIDVNNQSALDRINLQDAHAQDRLSQELAAAPQSPDGVSGGGSTQDIINRGTGKYTPPQANNGATITYDNGKSVTVPAHIISQFAGVFNAGNMTGDYSAGAAPLEALTRYYAAYVAAHNNDPPSVSDITEYLKANGYLAQNFG